MGYTHLPIYVRYLDMPQTISHRSQKPRIVSADERSRLALGKAGVSAYENFFVTVFDTGHIVLTPATAIPKNEMPLWNDGKFMDSLTKGISQAISGHTKSLNHLIPNAQPVRLRNKIVRPTRKSSPKVKV